MNKRGYFPGETRKRPNRPYGPAAALLVALVASACTVAPGMRMSVPAATSEAAATQPEQDMQIRIQEIDADLIGRQKAERRASLEPGVKHLIAPVRPYAIGIGDVLQITVWDHPELSAATANQNNSARGTDPAPGFIVDQHGDIRFPYAGTVHVANLSPEDAQRKLYDRLSASFRDPQITLRVASYRAKSVYVDGEVKQPGLQSINDIPMTLLEAVNRAGGFTPDADQGRLTLLRNGSTDVIDLTALVEHGIDPASIVLQPGDVLRVAGREDNGVFVMGEVTKPALAIPMKTGRLTLSQALAQVGSINSSTADARQLYVVRGMATATPQVYHLNAHSPVAMTLANGFQLQPNDVVYVDGNGLVRFSRVLSLLMPLFSTGMSAAILAK
ncbi:polysaccharide biosynthesis/export family protein [Burkholderia cenocepacia]|nr:polysaccharide biosynthesis/export family protein [Burkholderia cenocepacia]